MLPRRRLGGVIFFVAAFLLGYLLGLVFVCGTGATMMTVLAPLSVVISNSTAKVIDRLRQWRVRLSSSLV